MRHWYVVILLLATSARAATTNDFRRATEQLGAGKHSLREQASDLLWSAGEAAVPALEEALKSNDPEVAQRAREILEFHRTGIRPDTPLSIRALLLRYQSATDVSTRQAVIAELVTLGEPARPVLANLAAREPNPERRLQIFLPILEPYGEAIEAFYHDESPSAEQIADAIQATQYLTVIFPEDVAVPTRVIPKLDRLEKKKEADDLFARAFAAQQKVVAAQPDSADAHNNLAWLCAVARRQLDDGLTHAKKAVALAPKLAPYLDTLAELHFQKGDRVKATELVEKCIALDPDTEYFRLQRERFQTGKPDDLPPEPELMGH